MACYAIQIKLAFLSYTSFTDHCWISPQLIVHLYSEDMYTCITPPTWSSLHGCTLGGILPLFISGIYQRPVLSSSMCQVLSHNQLMYMMKHLIVELPYQELVTCSLVLPYHLIASPSYGYKPWLPLVAASLPCN